MATAFGNLSSYNRLPSGAAVIGPASLTYLTNYKAGQRVQSSKWLFEKYDPRATGKPGYKMQDPYYFWVSITPLERGPFGAWGPKKGGNDFSLHEKWEFRELAKTGQLTFNMKHIMEEPKVVFRLGDREAFARWIELPHVEAQSAPYVPLVRR